MYFKEGVNFLREGEEGAAAYERHIRSPKIDLAWEGIWTVAEVLKNIDNIISDDKKVFLEWLGKLLELGWESITQREVGELNKSLEPILK
eukprot:gnl/Chilomastix_caulleri/849.p2 GENE.gnl/Chilomastix_caulleri/849~~gnl/Chilomastix_caulleri/849.p2  ORF type:complete len:90 (+),score=20.41 gnl/Chilomastix_caulleri/849:86-355(+)